MLSSFVALFLAGWKSEAYGINDARVSMLFVCTFLGYVAAAAGVGTLARKVGFGRVMLISTLLELAENIINSSQQVSYGLMYFGFFVVGMTFSTQVTGSVQCLLCDLNKPLMWTGILHGIYGLGAFVSPLMATAMVSRGVPVRFRNETVYSRPCMTDSGSHHHYHFLYVTNVRMNVPVVAFAWVAFRGFDALPHQANERQPEEGSPGNAFRATLRSRAVWTLAIFFMLYVVVIVVCRPDFTSPWCVDQGSPEGASWVACCLCFGIALGLIFLPPLSMFMGERLAVMVYLAFAIGLECLAWFLPILASTAVCTAVVGMHADAFALMSSVGQSGSAFWPLIVGVMSTKKGRRHAG
ncbi:major facilitator superfamily domain-containing protein [Daedaleopsis nitida]|nr:major facilitator superfamily domain-containing protein [Daedaleopsis nitida]